MVWTFQSSTRPGIWCQTCSWTRRCLHTLSQFCAASPASWGRFQAHAAPGSTLLPPFQVSTPAMRWRTLQRGVIGNLLRWEQVLLLHKTSPLSVINSFNQHWFVMGNSSEAIKLITSFKQSAKLTYDVNVKHIFITGSFFTNQGLNSRNSLPTPQPRRSSTSSASSTLPSLDCASLRWERNNGKRPHPDLNLIRYSSQTQPSTLPPRRNTRVSVELLAHVIYLLLESLLFWSR